MREECRDNEENLATKPRYDRRMEAKISCRAFGPIFAMCRARGVDLSNLTDGLDVEMETLLTPRAFFSWSEGAVLIERLSERVGGTEAYGELIASIVEDPAAKTLQRFLRVGLTPRQNYSLVFRWVSSMTYPFLSSSVKALDKSTLRIEQRIPEPLPGCEPFMRSAIHLAIALPRIHGLPDANVSATVTDRHCRMTVTLPSRVRRFGRGKAWLAVMRDAPSVIEELIEHQMAVTSTNSALKDALADAKQREAALAAEVASKELAQQELATRSEQLLHAQRLDSLGRLAGGIAHDFNNVLTAIIGHTELLRRIHGDEPTQQALAEIGSASDRAAALTRRLLTFARKGAAQPRVIDASERIRHMEGLLRGLLPEVDFAFCLSALPLSILADEVQLEQVIVNLVVNARDAMPDGGRLEIRTSEAKRDARSWVGIEVIDSGVGMPAHVADKMFEPFFTTKGELGTGLGLATTYGIVAEAGGEIEVDSTPGTGTRIAVWWPRSESPAPARVAESEDESKLPQGTGHVLVIEDEPELRTLMTNMLTTMGFTVSSSPDAAGALQVAASSDIDMVVADVMLKGERGPAVVEALRELHPSFQVLFISGYVDDQTMSSLAGKPVLAKPFTMERLGREVWRLMSRH